jgi:tetratricopeptide (TPR) repeat protein
VSLLAVMQPVDKTAPDRPAYSETDYPQRSYGWSSEQAWRASKYLFIQAPRKELYDRTTDPGAKHDLSSTSAAVSNTLAEQLNTFRRRTTSSSKAPELAASPQREAQLAALGYLASSNTGHSTAPGQAMADPKDKIEIANQLEEALIAQQEGRLEDAIPLLQKVLAKDPNMAAAYQGLGSAWLGLKNYDKALPALRKAVELRPDSIIAREALAKALFESGDMEASAIELQAALTISPSSTHLRISLAAAYERLGRAPDARKELETTLQMDPESYEANFILGRILGQYWTASDALPYLEKAAELRPDSAEAHAALAQAYSSMGQEANAIRERMLAQRARMLGGR